MKKIQVLKPKYRIKETLNEVKECLEIWWTWMWFKTVEFENAWKKYTNLKYAHFLNSATSWLHLAFDILKETNNWTNWDEVISTPFTFISTNHAIKYVWLKPVFADIDDSLNLTPNSVISKITNKTKAIIFVWIWGNTANLLEIIEIAKKYKLKIILDAAHMAWSFINWKHVWFDVDVSVFSFQAVKNLPTADAWMICFNNEKLHKLAIKKSWLWINKDTFSRSNQWNYKWDYNVEFLWYKYHWNSIMASLWLIWLKYLDEDNNYRRKLVEKYIKNLKWKVKIIKHENEEESSRHLFQIVVNNREKVIDHLTSKWIFPWVHYKINTEYDLYKTNNRFEKAEFYSNHILSLPLHLDLTENDIDYISNILLEII